MAAVLLLLLLCVGVLGGCDWLGVGDGGPGPDEKVGDCSRSRGKDGKLLRSCYLGISYLQRGYEGPLTRNGKHPSGHVPPKRTETKLPLAISSPSQPTPLHTPLYS